MRILMLNYEFPPLGGGAANANRYLLEEFAEREGVTVDLVTSSPDEYREEQFSEAITVYRLDVDKAEIHYWTQAEILRYSWKAYRKSRALLDSREYDLVHAWFGIPCGMIARLLGKQYLVALRGSDVPGYNERFSWQYTVLKPFVKKVWRDASVVTANSEGLRDLAHETATLPIKVVPNGVAVDEFAVSHHERTPVEVLCVSRLVERKGIRYLLQALQNVDDTVLTIVGEGEREQELKELAETLGISHRVSFAGYVDHDEIHRYYENADMFVLPSFNEGMSNTVLEAMAAGLPVITTDTGGTAELVTDNGIVVPKGDATALTSAIREYRNQPERRRSDGTESRSRAEEMSWAAVADSYVELYQQ